MPLLHRRFCHYPPADKRCRAERQEGRDKGPKMADRPRGLGFSNRIEIKHPAGLWWPGNLEDARMAEPRLPARQIHITAESQCHVDIGPLLSHAQIEAKQCPVVITSEIFRHDAIFEHAYCRASEEWQHFPGARFDADMIPAGS